MASGGGRALKRRGSVVSSPVNHSTPTTALFAHFTGSRPGATHTRALLQRLCREMASVILSDYNLSTTPMNEVAHGIRSRLGDAGPAADKAVDWVVGVGGDGSIIGRPGTHGPSGRGV